MLLREYYSFLVLYGNPDSIRKIRIFIDLRNQFIFFQNMWLNIFNWSSTIQNKEEDGRSTFTVQKGGWRSRFLNINSHQVIKKFPHGPGVGISKIWTRNNWVHKPSKPTIDFQEMVKMSTPWQNLFITWWELMIIEWPLLYSVKNFNTR